MSVCLCPGVYLENLEEDPHGVVQEGLVLRVPNDDVEAVAQLLDRLQLVLILGLNKGLLVEGQEDRRRREDKRTGGQEDKGGQEDRRTGGQRTGGQEDRRTEGQEDKRTRGQEDKRTRGQEDKRTGGQENKRTRGQEDKRKRG